jgi:hypothetical protein
MALIVLTLTEALRSFMDEDAPNFVGYPADETEAAAAWAAAIDAYTGAGLLLTPLSATGAVAKPALQAALEGMSVPGAGPVVMEAAFLAYASALVPGMLPAFIGTPPPPVLSVLLAAQGALAIATPTPPAIQGAGVALVIDAWFRLGTATPSGGGPTVPWA